MGLGLEKLFRWGKRPRLSPFEKDRKRYEADVREQFLKLKEKGLSIPIFTL